MCFARIQRRLHTTCCRYNGSVTEYDAASSKHTITYDDGDVETTTLSACKVCVCVCVCVCLSVCLCVCLCFVASLMHHAPPPFPFFLSV